MSNLRGRQSSSRGKTSKGIARSLQLLAVFQIGLDRRAGRNGSPCGLRWRLPIGGRWHGGSPCGHPPYGLRATGYGLRATGYGLRAWRIPIGRSSVKSYWL